MKSEECVAEVTSEFLEARASFSAFVCGQNQLISKKRFTKKFPKILEKFFR